MELVVITNTDSKKREEYVYKEIREASSGFVAIDENEIDIEDIRFWVRFCKIRGTKLIFSTPTLKVSQFEITKIFKGPKFISE